LLLTIFKKITSIFLTGLTIKMMDDFLDKDLDGLTKENNMIVLLGSGIIPYILVLFSIACAIDSKISAGLFLSSYCLGMANDFTAKMPSGLYGYHESVLSLILGFSLLGIKTMASSLFVMAAVQLWDDYVDFDNAYFTKKNWAVILGKGECLILGGIFFLCSFYLNMLLAITVAISTYIIVYIINILSTCTRKNQNY